MDGITLEGEVISDIQDVCWFFERVPQFTPGCVYVQSDRKCFRQRRDNLPKSVQLSPWKPDEKYKKNRSLS